MKTIVDTNYPVHFVNAWTKNKALCGLGWLQATGSEQLVTCPNCKRLLALCLVETDYSKMKINELLKLLRKQHGLKLREVSKQTGLSVSYISDLERGRQDPSLETCRKFADVYDLTLSKLFENVT